MPTPETIEETRIKAAYDRRQALSADLYSFTSPAHLHLLQDRERHVLRLLGGRLWPLQDKRLLEIGCGTGYWLRQFIQWGARPDAVAGVDLLPARVEIARQQCPEGIGLHCTSATDLPFAAGTFDLVLQSTVFTSILDDDVKRRIAAEMLRVLKPGGGVLWYDYLVNNPRNPDVRGVNASEIRSLFAGCDVTLQRITLAPPVARAVAPYSRLACDVLARMPFLCTHYLGWIRKS